MELKSSKWIGPIREGKYTGYIDWNGELVLQTEFVDLGEFREGLACVAVPDGSQYGINGFINPK